MSRTDRHEGIDALRVVAMLMVVAFHALDEGGWIWSEPTGAEVYWWLWGWLVSCVDVLR